ncbi:hypothetical protein [Halobacillus sp. K22]|uniref:hypothetical protein n=1 Tax=Halobacillus sp. K22 TaxID=3457431 RepID=UPI003FCD4FB8
MNQKAKTLAASGFISFLSGIGVFLLDFLSALHFHLPLLTLGGICLITIAVFFSYSSHKKSR